MKSITTAVMLLAATFAFSQSGFDYEPNGTHPFGRPNPNAPSQIKDYEQLIGKSKCQSFARNTDGTWADPVDMLWTFKYIMNGMGVQDETLKADGTHSGSIRQYSADSSRWYVHYYTNRRMNTVLSAWEGNMDNDKNKIVLSREQPAPNGTKGDYRLTFSDFSGDGFKWVGEWVDKTKTVIYPTWRIDCSEKL